MGLQAGNQPIIANLGLSTSASCLNLSFPVHTSSKLQLQPVRCLALLVLCLWNQPRLLSEVSFSRDILPILSDHCFQCHGPDQANRKGNLRLDQFESAVEGGKGEGVIVPGDPARSLLVERIHALDAESLMPPPEINKPLSLEKKQLLEKWIQQGAPWGQHWSFVPPKRPNLDATQGHPIDVFIDQKLREKGMSRSPSASDSTQLRRLSLDLTGLPPSEALLESFKDRSIPDAWERQVERLLESPHYGERMAMWWLDASRYADTDGFQQDGTRNNWAWRDWVIQAFNSNMPFDTFTRLQFAGDLVDGASPETILATCFHRNHMTNGEGGRDPEESRIDYVIDRVNTVGTLWMGLTLGCAQCHTHKFDPISHQEYYQLSAYFNSIDESGRAGSNAKPYLDYQAPLAEAQWQAAQRHLQQASGRLEAAKEMAMGRFKPWLGEMLERVRDAYSPWEMAHPGALESNHGTELRADDEGVIVATGPNPRHEDYRVIWQPSNRYLTGIRLEVFKDPSNGQGRYGRGAGGEFILTNAKLFKRRRGASLIHEIPIAHAIADFEAKPREGERYGVIAHTLDDDPRNGWTTHDDPEASSRKALFALKTPIRLGEDEELVWVMMHRSTLGDANVGKFQIATTQQPGEALQSLNPSALEQLASLKLDRPEDIDPMLKEGLLTQFLAGDDAYQQAKKDHDRYQDHFKEMEAGNQAQPVMVLAERSEPRQTHILIRGVWDKKGEPVDPGVPSMIKGLGDMPPQNRLELASWLVSEDHPLTARVMVNHLWQLIFGAGLVRTPEDFGLQGEPPTHPELLDWLAVEFMESGWDIKHMIRLMVRSDTYRQQSKVTPAMMDADPTNRWWARASRHRLPSWMIHDAVLCTSGLLHPALGGPPVRPFQPAGIWQDMFMGKFTYEPSPGSARYRRMIYAFWRRSSSPAFLFDQAQRRVCEVRQRRTNTPLQALTLLNDQTLLEASQYLAAEALRRHSPEQALAWVCRRILGRSLDSAEEAILTKQWAQMYEQYQQHTDQAIAYITVGEQVSDPSLDPALHASVMWVANMIYNLDEAMTHE